MKHPQYWVLTLMFFIVLFSFWQSTDQIHLLERLRIKLPFIGLPLAFIALPKFSSRQIRMLMFVLIGYLCLLSLWIWGQYIGSYEEINFLLKRGHPMPTPGSHIRFASLMAVGVVTGVHVLTSYSFRRKLTFYLLLIATLYLFLFMHFLAVRTGLLLIYSGLFVLIFTKVLILKNKMLGIISMLALLVIPFLAYKTVPSLQNKINYMIHDAKMYKTNKKHLYSDSGRLISIEIALELWKESPIVGIGSGNLYSRMEASLNKNYPEMTAVRMPHNQLIYVLAANGIVGLILFIVAFFFPIFYQHNYKVPIFIALQVMIFMSFMTEHSIENAVGVAFYLVITLIGLNQLVKTEKTVTIP